MNGIFGQWARSLYYCVPLSSASLTRSNNPGTILEQPWIRIECIEFQVPRMIAAIQEAHRWHKAQGTRQKARGTRPRARCRVFALDMPRVIECSLRELARFAFVGLMASCNMFNVLNSSPVHGLFYTALLAEGRMVGRTGGRTDGQ